MSGAPDMFASLFDQLLSKLAEGEVTELSTAVKHVAKALPAFARDLYLYMMERKSDDQGGSKRVEYMKGQGLYCDESFLLSIRWLGEMLLAL